MFDETNDLVKEYAVPENHEGIEFRLFVNGNASPLIPGEEDDLVVPLSAS